MMSSDDLLSYELAEGEDPALLNEDELLLSDDGKLSGGGRFLLIWYCKEGNRFSVQPIGWLHLQSRELFPGNDDIGLGPYYDYLSGSIWFI